MRRRSMLVTVGTLAGLAGCLGSRTNRTSVEPKPSPDWPDDLTAASVLEYVRDYEETRVHNATIDSDVTDISISCVVALDRVIDGTYYVISACYGSAAVETTGPFGFGSSIAHHDLETSPVTTLVDRTDRKRFEQIGYEVSEPVGDEPRLRVANFDSQPHTITVTVTREGESRDRAFDETIPLDAGTDRVETGLGLEWRDRYEIEATVEGGPSVTDTWERDERFDGYEIRVVDDRLHLVGDDEHVILDDTEHVLADIGVYVTPDGALDIARHPTGWA